MPNWLQHLLVLLAVAACAVVVGRQTLATLWGRKSRLGQCCSHGCAAHVDDVKATPLPPDPQVAAIAPQRAERPERVVFLPVEMLARKRQSR
jgi:hypothetical protein